MSALDILRAKVDAMPWSERRFVPMIGKCGRGHSVSATLEDVCAGWIACDCGSHAIAKAVKVTFRAIACDGRCTSAMGPSCSCSCGGRNHGSDMRFGS